MESSHAPFAVEVPDGVGAATRGAGVGAGAGVGGDASVGVEEEFNWLN